MSNTLLWVYVFCALGIVCRTLLPYLQLVVEQLRDHNYVPSWNWYYIVGPVASVIINLFIMPFVAQNLVGTESWAMAYIAGWGISDMSREIQKAIEGVRS